MLPKCRSNVFQVFSYSFYGVQMVFSLFFLWEKGAFWGAFKAFLRGIKVLFGVFLVVQREVFCAFYGFIYVRFYKNMYLYTNIKMQLYLLYFALIFIYIFMFLCFLAYIFLFKQLCLERCWCRIFFDGGGYLMGGRFQYGLRFSVDSGFDGSSFWCRSRAGVWSFIYLYVYIHIVLF